MKELGSYLRRTRIENGVNLEEAADDMNISVTQLESIESGNTRAFKDVYKLKQQIKMYAKYLGLNPDKVIDEFNEFLFEHTSKISLDDIRIAREKEESKEQENKIKSPYTIEHKRKINIWPIVGIVGGILILITIITILVVHHVSKTSPRTSELKNIIKVNEVGGLI